jgi:hypothetical protein
MQLLLQAWIPEDSVASPQPHVPGCIPDKDEQIDNLLKVSTAGFDLKYYAYISYEIS